MTPPNVACEKLGDHVQNDDVEDSEDNADKVTAAKRKKLNKPIDEEGEAEDIKHPKIQRRRWTAVEHDMVFLAFGKEICKKIIPDGTRLAELACKMNTGRTVAQLRSYVHNYISGKSKAE
jgi:hypothetical protein